MKKYIRQKIDALIYAFIGPFGVLYIFPKFFLMIEDQMNFQFNKHLLLNIIGTILMWLGALIAIWSSIIMHLNKKSSPSPFSLPQEIVEQGPYSFVRHPMMWSLNIVLIGEIIVWNSPMLIVWLIIWIRFSVLYIDRYEEPYLISIFGKRYTDYCKKTPRWFPLFRLKK